MATINGTAATGVDELGVFREGWRADIVGKPQLEPAPPRHDALSHYVFAAHGDDVPFTCSTARW